MVRNPSSGPTRAHVDSPNFSAWLAHEIAASLSDPLGVRSQPLTVVCIGTDRSTGDALGPLVGSRLTEWRSVRDRIRVVGTLDEPVHAGNLRGAIQALGLARPGAGHVLAVDACLGRVGSIGYITVGEGPLKPGAGVNKELPQVGDAYITGVVNVGGFMEYLVLQNTRLSLVIKMADAIARGVVTYVVGPT
ncbi:MAG: spore protease YyaC [Firmicutes bacterium]|nr:spore protease YyaC [Bacillota bacterium]